MDEMTKFKVERIAEVCHRVNAAYCAALGDNSQLTWNKAPEWQKSSARKGVEMHLANPASTPEDSHNGWMAEKVAAGWVYGATKDSDAKPPTHPCLVPFDQLALNLKVKDHLFLAVVRALE